MFETVGAVSSPEVFVTVMSYPLSTDPQFPAWSRAAILAFKVVDTWVEGTVIVQLNRPFPEGFDGSKAVQSPSTPPPGRNKYPFTYSIKFCESLTSALTVIVFEPSDTLTDDGE